MESKKLSSSKGENDQCVQYQKHEGQVIPLDSILLQ